MENAQRKQHPQVLIERLNSVMLIMNYFPLSYISTVLIQIYMYSNPPPPPNQKLFTFNKLLFDVINFINQTQPTIRRTALFKPPVS